MIVGPAAVPPASGSSTSPPSPSFGSESASRVVGTAGAEVGFLIGDGGRVLEEDGSGGGRGRRRIPGRREIGLDLARDSKLLSGKILFFNCLLRAVRPHVVV